MRSVYQEPSFALEFLQRACTDEYVCLRFRRCHWIHQHFGRTNGIAPMEISP
jgi:hypothetical protein